jgi:acetyl esterase/lipase
VIVEDCYAALLWVGKSLGELGINPDCLMVAGFLAGGGLAASTALMCRDRAGPRVCAQLLMLLMLDDRSHTVSSKQFWSHGTFTGGLAAMSWSCVLGAQAGGGDISYHVVAGRATVRDLADLPEAYIEVGANKPFRDDAVAYALKLWKAGSQAELHIWAGGPHCFEMYQPTANIPKAAKKTREAWTTKVLQRSKEKREDGTS